MTIEQNADNGDGYERPSRGTLPPISYTFQVTINPCRITRYIVETAPQRLTYIIGDDFQATGGFYNFIEEGTSCNYEATTTFQGKESWLIHNSVQQDFTVAYTEDTSLAQIYQVQIISTISQPTSASDTTPILTTAETTLEVVLVDPCKLTEILPDWSLSPIQAVVASESPVNSIIPEALDQASIDFGDKSGFGICGPRKYEIVTDQAAYSNWLTFDGVKTLSVQTAD